MAACARFYRNGNKYVIKRGLVRENPLSTMLIYSATDVAAVIIGSVISYYFRFNTIILKEQYLQATVLAVVFTVLIFFTSKIYRSWRTAPILKIIINSAVSLSKVFLMLILVAYVTKTSDSYSRQWLIVWFVVSLFLLSINRSLIYSLLRYLRRRGWNIRRIILIGDGEAIKKLVNRLREAPWLGIDIKYIIDIDGNKEEKYRVIDTNSEIDGLSKLIHENKIDELWLALAPDEKIKLRKLFYEIRHEIVALRWLPNLENFNQFSNSLPKLYGIPVIDLEVNRITGFNSFVKLVEDYILATIFLIVAAPCMVLIAAAIKAQGQGPVIFKQLRHGWNGEEIEVWKFRSMRHADGEKTEPYRQASKNDYRITKLGKIIRATSLDELPQLINVLQGKMSIVGPRPHPVELNKSYMEEIDKYMHRHKVKPGITGLAQVRGWRGETKKIEDMKKRIESDLEYIDTWSLWLDIKILARTIVAVITAKNAY